jgi:hypothetical protein
MSAVMDLKTRAAERSVSVSGLLSELVPRLWMTLRPLSLIAAGRLRLLSAANVLQ